MKPAYRCDIRMELPATLEAIEGFFLDFRARASSARCSATCKAEWFAVELLLRETLTNAVVHGCQADPAKRVQCIVRCRPGWLTIAVRDNGRGFNWHKVWRESSAPTDCSGRGIEILRHYATRVRFSASGNQTVLVKQLSKEYQYE